MAFWRIICVALPSSVVGVLLTLYVVNGTLVPGKVSYNDLAATLLAATSVIIAIFGGVLAIAAFWGFEQMRIAAVKAATEASVAASVTAAENAATVAAAAAALDEIRDQIENGPLRTYMGAEIRTVIYSPEFRNELLLLVQRIALGRREDADLDADTEDDNG